MSFTISQKKKFRGVRLRMEGPRHESPSSSPTLKKLPVEKGMKTMGEVRWCTI
jgi:hypothetical protein